MSDANGNPAHELYHTGLRNQHAVENQAIELLERQLGRMDAFPEMKARIQRHLEESRAQAQRLDQLLEQHGTSASTVKDTVMSFMGNMAALAHTPAPDEVIKNTIANFAFEHFEIAAYKSLIALAEQIGDTNGVRVLTTSLQEEEAMAGWIDEHIAPTTLKFAAMKAAA
jgi:ferritin-like metal-binding protein YciE